MRSGSWTRTAEPARLHHILIDHENVQPADLAGLDAHDACVWVFTGAQQKVAISLIEAVQTLGERGRFVRISGNGRNALDFHIAYYLGRFAASDRQASFLIVSADAGYDPLIAHVNAQGVAARRISLPQAVAPPTPASKTVSPPSGKPAQQPKAAPARKIGKKVTVTVDPPRSATPPATGKSTTDSSATPRSTGNAAKPSPGNPQADVDTVVRRLVDMPKSLPGSEASLRRMVGTWLSKDAKRLDAVLAALKQRGIVVSQGAKVGYHLPKA